MIIRTYSELKALPTFAERFEYLKLDGRVGEDTFGLDRYLNQVFYKSQRWKAVRDQVILRDNGCDLGVAGCEINGRILIHHMNPITLKDIETDSENMLDPEYLICVTHKTHNAIHYGNPQMLASNRFVERTKNDTCPWWH